jgi:hypothetical protein
MWNAEDCRREAKLAKEAAQFVTLRTDQEELIFQAKAFELRAIQLEASLPRSGNLEA